MTYPTTTLDWLKTLIRFDTVSRNSNLNLIHCITDYATEGGQFTQAGIPTVICGCGDIANAHKANEFVSLEQLEKCEKFLGQILQSCLT